MHQRYRAAQQDLGSRFCTREESNAKEKEASWPISSTPFPEEASLDRELIFTSDSSNEGMHTQKYGLKLCRSSILPSSTVRLFSRFKKLTKHISQISHTHLMSEVKWSRSETAHLLLHRNGLTCSFFVGSVVVSTGSRRKLKGRSAHQSSVEQVTNSTAIQYSLVLWEY